MAEEKKEKRVKRKSAKTPSALSKSTKRVTRKKVQKKDEGPQEEKSVEAQVEAVEKSPEIQNRAWPVVRSGRQPESLRKARGFSTSELVEAGISINGARMMGLFVDLKRGTKYVENVSLLKSLIGG